MSSRMRRSFLVLVLCAASLSLGSAVAPWLPSPDDYLAAESGVSVAPQDRVIVFAPHSDDEVLGAGGLIARAVRVGARVMVVLVTNGDGYYLAAEDRFRLLRVSPDRFMRLAYDRQQESVTALSDLGFSRQGGDIVFLGYPDKGVARLWERNWSEPYVSHYTRTVVNPYTNSRRPGELYCGLNLFTAVRDLMLEFKPTVVVMPHPCDVHPDHWATANFVRAALALSSPEGLRAGEPVRILCYLVHRGEWPLPRGFNADAALAPPAHLRDLGRWVSMPLSPGERQLKARAIRRYRSQIALAPRFLMSFARSNELFDLDNGRLAEDPAEYPAEDPAGSADSLPPRAVVGAPEGWKTLAWAQGHSPGRERARPWPEVQVLPGGPDGVCRPAGQGTRLVMLDPVGDTLATRVDASADIRSLRVAVDRDGLEATLDTRGQPGRLASYLIRVREIGSDDGGSTAALTLSPTAAAGRQAGGAGTDAPGKPGKTVSARVRVPLRVLGKKTVVLISAEAAVRGIVADRTAWGVLTLSETD